MIGAQFGAGAWNWFEALACGDVVASKKPAPDIYVRALGMLRLPAENWKLENRGCLDAGCYADLVVFDPATIQDHATFEKPQQYATGVRDVFVNGVAVLNDGTHTGAKPGRVVRGPGWRAK